MGNSAIIKTANGHIGMYLHWNGGRDSVEAFLKYCDLRGFRSPEVDGYGWARLAQVVGNYFGGGLSVGIVELSGVGDGAGCDNGTYIIHNWKIIGREDFDGPEQHEYKLEAMLREIDEAQPPKDRLGDYLNATEVSTDSLKIGDVIFFRDALDRGVEKQKIVGIGKPGKVVNGRDVNGVPYMDRFGFGNPGENINNYVRDKTVRIVR